MTINLPNYLLLIITLLTTITLVNTMVTTIQSIGQTLKNRERREQFINNHPEMKGIDVDEDELMVFTSGERIKDLVLMNEEETDNIPLMTKLMDEFELDEDDDDLL